MSHTLPNGLLLLFLMSLQAQQPQGGTPKKPFQAQSSSTIAYSFEGASEGVDITNVAYEVAGPGVPGRPPEERLTLRTTTRLRQVIGDIGIEATITVAAWPLGMDLTQKPLYSTTVSGVDMKTLNGEAFVISRGLEEVEWWSVYKLGSGEHLFDTHTPLVQFSPSREEFLPRYVGLETPPDDATDPRLKVPNVVGVLSYASGDRVIRELLITSDNAKTAGLLRSYADSTRSVSVANSRVSVSISRNYPSPASTISFTVPIVRDDFDVARSQLRGGIRVTPWKR